MKHAIIPSLAALAAFVAPASAAETVALDNPYVHVTRDGAPCATAGTPGCGDRVIVAMSDVEVKTANRVRMLAKGLVAVFGPDQSYEPPQGDYFEVAIKPDHPPVKSPAEIIAPAKNQMLYEGDRFIVYEEDLAVGDTRERHSHSQRVEIRLNQGPQLEQVVDGRPAPIEPQIVNWREPVIHSTHNVGDMDLRNLIVEFRPQGR